MANALRRDQVPVESTWNLADIYPSPAAWEADLQAVEAALPALSAYRGRLGEGPGTLLAFLQARDAAAERFAKVGAYANLGLAVDGTSAAAQAMYARVTALAARIGAALSFVANEVLALPEGALEGAIEAEPALAVYRPQFDAILRRRAHMLAPEAEQALAALGEALNLPYSVWQRTSTADVACAPVDDSPVSVARWQAGLGQAPNRELRRRAFESLTAGLDRHKHTLATTLTAHVQRNVVVARLRGYHSAVDMILAPQQVPEGVYRTILQVVHDGMQPHVQRLLRLRQRVLGIDELRFYDLQAPLDEAPSPPLSYAEAERLIRSGLQVLGDEYDAMVAAAFGERWIDYAENLGKRSGAFCAGVYGVHSYILTTWQGQLRNALTLAHELGHAGQQVFSARSQIVSNTPGFGTAAFGGLPSGRFFSEAPSTANELLVGWHLLDTTADPRLRRAVIQQFLGTFIHNMVTHMLEAHFEQRLYDLAEAGEPITTSTVLDVQGEVFARFYGDTLALDDGARLYWMQQPHFYMDLYPYNYSAGLACGFGVAEAIRREGQPAAERWLDVLRAGYTLPPLELARRAGVDMTRPEPLQRAVDYFGTLVDELEQAVE